MLVLDGKTDLNQISLTGARAITLIGLLTVAPRSLEEIREKFLEYKIMDKSHSDDIIRVDLNTIKSMGCEVSRSSQKTKFKYVLKKHPFSFNVSSEDISILRKLFNKIKNSTDISLLIEYDQLIKNISKYISDEDLKEEFIGVSPLIRYDIDMISDLEVDCKHQNTLELMYQKPTEKNPSLKRLIAKKLVFRNDKLYFHCYNLDKNDSMILNCKGIRSVVSRKLTQNHADKSDVKIRFYLKDFEQETLDYKEVIIKEDKKGALVEGAYFNNFLAMQRVLSFGSKCIVEEPTQFKNMIISKLKEMRSLYE